MNSLAWIECELFDLDGNIKMRHCVEFCERKIDLAESIEEQIAVALESCALYDVKVDKIGWPLKPNTVLFFYGGWIDQAVFGLRWFWQSSLLRFNEAIKIFDRDPIEESGDAVFGIVEQNHEFVLIVEHSVKESMATAAYYTASIDWHAKLEAAKAKRDKLL